MILIGVIPIVGLMVSGVVYFRQLDRMGQSQKTLNETFEGILRENVPDMVEMDEGIRLMLNADRDAYQADVALTQSLDLHGDTDIKAIQADFEENFEQVGDRLAQSKGILVDEENSIYGNFLSDYSKWGAAGRDFVRLSVELKGAFVQQNADMAKSVATFDAMRSQLDGMVGIIESAIVAAGDESNTNQLHSVSELNGVLSLLLNADRDLYQSYTAQLQLDSNLDSEAILALSEEYKSNVAQVHERCDKASVLFDAEASALYKQFKKDFTVWEALEISSLNELWECIKRWNPVLGVKRLLRRDFPQCAVILTSWRMLSKSGSVTVLPRWMMPQMRLMPRCLRRKNRLKTPNGLLLC